MLKILLTVFVALTFGACSWCQETIYVDKPYPVYVPVKCKVPDANCSFDRNTSTEVVNSLVECIIDMKRNAEVCQ
jgi:hypothetical protein